MWLSRSLGPLGQLQSKQNLEAKPLSCLEKTSSRMPCLCFVIWLRLDPARVQQSERNSNQTWIYLAFPEGDAYNHQACCDDTTRGKHGLAFGKEKLADLQHQSSTLGWLWLRGLEQPCSNVVEPSLSSFVGCGPLVPGGQESQLKPLMPSPNSTTPLLPIGSLAQETFPNTNQAKVPHIIPLYR